MLSLAVAALAFLGQLRGYRVMRQLRFKDLQERTQAVAFWTAWIEAQKLVSSPAAFSKHQALAQRELSDLATFPAREAAAATGPRLPNILLFQRPKRSWTWIPQTLFHLTCILSVLYMIVGLNDLGSQQLTAGRLVIYVASLTFILVVAAALRQCALLVDGLGQRPRQVR